MFAKARNPAHSLLVGMTLVPVMDQTSQGRVVIK